MRRYAIFGIGVFLLQPVAYAATIETGRISPSANGTNIVLCSIANLGKTPREVEIELVADSTIVLEQQSTMLAAQGGTILSGDPGVHGRCRFTVEGAKNSYRANGCVFQVSPANGCVSQEPAR